MNQRTNEELVRIIANYINLPIKPDIWDDIKGCVFKSNWFGPHSGSYLSAENRELVISSFAMRGVQFIYKRTSGGVYVCEIVGNQKRASEEGKSIGRTFCKALVKWIELQE